MATKTEKKCAVIDPTGDIQTLVDFTENEGLTITDICKTHVHADFISAIKNSCLPPIPTFCSSPFFPLGNIGDPAAFGTINDLAMCGVRPLYLSCGFILEGGGSGGLS